MSLPQHDMLEKSFRMTTDVERRGVILAYVNQSQQQGSFIVKDTPRLHYPSQTNQKIRQSLQIRINYWDIQGTVQSNCSISYHRNNHK